MINSNTRVISLIGYPARHSLSPVIHNYLLQKTRKNAVYLVFEFKPGEFKQAFNGLKKLGFIGLNVTMPYKEKVYQQCTYLDKTSKLTKSVNTVKFKGNKEINGYNTDVYGFLKSLEDKNFKFDNKNCLIIGAGGAARSVVYGLLSKKVTNIYLYNRTVKNAENLKNYFINSGRGNIKIIKDFKKLSEKDIELIVNCTPIGMNLEDSLKKSVPVPVSWNLKNKYIFEMVYEPIKTRFLQKAESESAKVICGLDMLVNQAVYSFKIWFDMEEVPQTRDIREKIKKILMENENEFR